MKTTALFVSLFLVLAIPAFTGALHGKQANTAPHQITGALEGTITFVPFGSGYFDVYSLSVASGQLKGLGNSNIFTFHIPDPSGSGVVSFGRFFIVAADGNRIQGTYSGTTAPGAKPGQLIGTADWEITGGTGRFADATGRIQATAVSYMAPSLEWPVTWVLEGTVYY